MSVATAAPTQTPAQEVHALNLRQIFLGRTSASGSATARQLRSSATFVSRENATGAQYHASIAAGFGRLAVRGAPTRSRLSLSDTAAPTVMRTVPSQIKVTSGL